MYIVSGKVLFPSQQSCIALELATSKYCERKKHNEFKNKLDRWSKEGHMY